MGSNHPALAAPCPAWGLVRKDRHHRHQPRQMKNQSLGCQVREGGFSLWSK